MVRNDALKCIGRDLFDELNVLVHTRRLAFRFDVRRVQCLHRTRGIL